ncbi:MAG: hypothetical protein KA715_13435 [Xanthomonadaceae bacterium]|nr:hypothetical protein [Xanthomonadaceae bacterium]
MKKLTLLALIFCLTNCTKNHDEDDVSQVFFTSFADDIKTLDPANANDIFSTEVTSLIYESLYQYSYLEAPYKIVPLLASDLPKYSHDRLTVTIPIRKSIRFQNGRELTAHDFVYSWKRLAHPGVNSTGFWIFDDKIVGLNKFRDSLAKADKKTRNALFQTENVSGLTALDNNTLQIKLTRPFPQLEHVLTMTFAAAVPKEVIDKQGDENGNLMDKPLGSGPFMLKEWDRNHKIVLVRNPSYHVDFYPSVANAKYEKKGLLADSAKTLPFLDKVVIHILRESQPAWLNFLSGKIDRLTLAKDQFQSALDLSERAVSPELKSKGIELSVEPTGWFYYVAFSSKDPLLGKNKLLRQALSSSINRKEWVQLFTQNQGIIADQVLPPGVPDRPMGLSLKYDFNLERAKSLLAKAGFPGGKGLPIIKMDMRGADSLSRQLGEFFTHAFSQIGVTIDVVYNTFPAFLQKSKEGNLQMYLGGWVMDYPDPENVWQLLYSANRSPGPNDASYANPAFDKLYKTLAVVQPGPTRTPILKQMDDLIQEDCPWALGYTVTAHRLTQSWLKNFRYSDVIQNSIKYYRVDLREKRKSQGN